MLSECFQYLKYKCIIYIYLLLCAGYLKLHIYKYIYIVNICVVSDRTVSRELPTEYGNGLFPSVSFYFCLYPNCHKDTYCHHCKVILLWEQQLGAPGVMLLLSAPIWCGCNTHMKSEMKQVERPADFTILVLALKKQCCFLKYTFKFL